MSLSSSPTTASGLDGAPGLDRRQALLGLGLLATAGAAAAATPRRFERQLGAQKVADLLPSGFGEWRERPNGDVIVPEETQPDSVYDQVATRTYVNGAGAPVTLLIAYGAAQSGLMKVHRPEVCYASAGFQIADAGDYALSLEDRAIVPARTFQGLRSPRREQVLYWTRVANAFPQSMNAERWVSFRAGLRGVIPDGVLVRFSTSEPDLASGSQLLSRAARGLVQACGPVGRRFLVGSL